MNATEWLVAKRLLSEQKWLKPGRTQAQYATWLLEIQSVLAASAQRKIIMKIKPG